MPSARVENCMGLTQERFGHRTQWVLPVGRDEDQYEAGQRGHFWPARRGINEDISGQPDLALTPLCAERMEMTAF